MTKLRCLSIRKNVFEHPGDSGLANTSVRGNIAGGVTMGGKGNDVFLVSSRDGVHIRSGVPWHLWTAYIALISRYHHFDNHPTSVPGPSH